jgi:hypothetical protein
VKSWEAQHQELSAFVFPIETVYATIEVKGLLQRRDLKKIIADANKVRALAEHKWYVHYGVVPKDKARSEQGVLEVSEFQRTKPKPRAYVVAFDQTGWRSAEALRASIANEYRKRRATHLHGVVVLSEDWFITQRAWEPPADSLEAKEGNALLRFVRRLVHDISSMPMDPMAIDRYMSTTSEDRAAKHKRR